MEIVRIFNFGINTEISTIKKVIQQWTTNNNNNNTLSVSSELITIIIKFIVLHFSISSNPVLLSLNTGVICCNGYEIDITYNLLSGSLKLSVCKNMYDHYWGQETFGVRVSIGNKVYSLIGDRETMYLLDTMCMHSHVDSKLNTMEIAINIVLVIKYQEVPPLDDME